MSRKSYYPTLLHTRTKNTVVIFFIISKFVSLYIHRFCENVKRRTTTIIISSDDESSLPLLSGAECEKKCQQLKGSEMNGKSF